MTFMLSFGRWGGVYFRHSSASTRLCVGWMAFTLLRLDIDDVLNEWAALAKHLRVADT